MSFSYEPLANIDSGPLGAIRPYRFSIVGYIKGAPYIGVRELNMHGFVKVYALCIIDSNINQQ